MHRAGWKIGVTKESKKTFGGEECGHYLDMVIVSQIYMCQTQQTVHFNYVQFSTGQLYLQKAV